MAHITDGGGAAVTIDALLLELRARRLILIDESTVWPSPRLTCTIRRAIRRHKKGLALLLRYADISVCCSPPWHRRHWKYAGAGSYVCEICEQFAV